MTKSYIGCMATLLLLLTCSAYTHADSKTPAAKCEFASVVFSADFDAGKLDACQQVSAQRYQLTTLPEDQPINPSPWYAFDIHSKSGVQEIEVVLQAKDAKARYIPKKLQANGEWQSMPFSVQDNNLRITLNINDTPMRIAAQAIIDNQDYQEWMDNLANNSLAQKINIGRSTQGRAIDGLIHRSEEANEWLLIIGRQHPPELTGAMALLSFVETLLSSSAIDSAFYQRFNILVIPNLNPDGVALGHWRHNTKGKDLNRDWGKFTQRETQQVNDKLAELLVNDQRLVFALDFHSTQQNIFYTMPNDYALAPSDFVDTWLKQLKSDSLSSFVVRPKPGSSPGRGVFKQYMADQYHIHSVTYEIGDNTDHNLIRHVAQSSAVSLTSLMNATPPEAFVWQEKSNTAQ